MHLGEHSTPNMVMQIHVDLLVEAMIDMEAHHQHQDHYSVDRHLDTKEAVEVDTQCRVDVIPVIQAKVV